MFSSSFHLTEGKELKTNYCFETTRLSHMCYCSLFHLTEGKELKTNHGDYFIPTLSAEHCSHRKKAQVAKLHLPQMHFNTF